MNTKYNMIDYIYEAGPSLQRTLFENEDGIIQTVDQMRQKGIERIILTGMGSSYTAAVMAYPLMRIHSSIPVHVIPSTELAYYFGSLINEQAAVISVSRSGERGWVVNSLNQSIEQGAMSIAITGVSDSLLARNASIQWITQEGQESCFPKTKSVITCSGLLMRLALALSGTGDETAQKRLDTLRSMPKTISKIVSTLDTQVQDLISFIREHSILLICGTGSNYGTALESAIKLQETTDITSLSDDTGNFFHGPLAPLNPDWLLIPLVHSSDIILSTQLLKLAKKIGAHTLSIAEKGLDIAAVSDRGLNLPVMVDQMMASLAYLPVVQLINYHLAVAMGKNPDRPEAATAILEAILPPGRKEPDY